MKRLAAIEISVFFVVGFILFVWPQEMTVAHATDNGTGLPGGYVEFVTKFESRIYGIFEMLLGIGIATFTLLRAEP
jgi:hypothetical protein